MSQTSIQKTRSKLTKVYGGGILLFAAIVGGITLIASFLGHLNWS